jgi:uncharacterized protein DUF4038/collagenase-like protein with putative collagen-binding domain
MAPASAALSSGQISAPAGPFPLRLSNGVVKDAQGQPYYIVADAAWTLLANVPFCSTPTDDSCNRNDNIAYYFKERAAAGFNTALVALACDTYITCVTTWDRLTRGLVSRLTHWHPAAGTGAAYDGTLPFTASVSGCSPSGSWPCWNLADPNPGYFAELVQLVNVAARYGVQVGIVPINNNQCEPSYGQQDLKNNTTAAVSGFGSYLASRFKSLPNVIWFEGNDYNCYTTAADDSLNYSIATNIISGGDSHLQTLEVGNGEGAASLTDVTNSWSSVLGINLIYTYYTTYYATRSAYGQSSSIPALMGETNYQGEDNTGGQNSSGITGCSSARLTSSPYCPIRERQQEWWAATSGSNAGQMTGNVHVYKFDGSWTSNLNTTPDQQFVSMTKFLRNLKWWLLDPDSGNTLAYCGSSGTACGTSAGASGNNVTSNYVTAALTSDNTEAVVYLPNAFSGSVTIDMAKFPGTVTGRWFDPATGSYSPVSGSPWSNTGTQTIAKNSGTHSDGTGDWVLLLTAPQK